LAAIVRAQRLRRAVQTARLGRLLEDLLGSGEEALAP
jgi:hypothetical protein